MTQEQPESRPKPPESRPPVLWTNMITLLGMLVIALSILLLVTFWMYKAITPEHGQNQYLNIFGYMILPGILVTGLLMCPLGIMFKRWRNRHYGVSRHIPVRYAVSFLLISFFLTIPILGISTYAGYHYSESSEFCGTACHEVMSPHYTVYQASPHARVTCAECHIGPGASPFVKSKMSGLRQVYAVATNSFPRPIPPAIAQLRPARETCEQCHWPEQFFGSQLKVVPRYLHQKDNPRHEMEMLVKVGGQNKHLGRAEGIHMHMLDKVRYIATDHDLQVIPWVEYTHDDGTVTIYRSDGKPSDSPPPDGVVRQLDCMDCHNRIGHEFLSPQRAVDIALNAGRIDPAIPFIKREAVIALTGEYDTQPAALEKIEETLTGYYQNRHPEVWDNQQDQLLRSVKAIQHIYRQNFFPEMNVDWQDYPNNIGHMESPGCFRCHDGLHVGEGEKVITSDCMSCHTFLERVEEDVIIEGRFTHDMTIHDLWDEMGPHRSMRCDECHNGGTRAWGVNRVSENCGDCHESGRWLEMKKDKPSFVLTTRPGD